MTTGQRVAQAFGIALIVFAAVLWATRYNASSSPPGTRRERLDVWFKRLPGWVFIAGVVVGVALLAYANA